MKLPDYVDEQLTKSGKIHKAAILGQAGGVWAISKGYTVRYCFDRSACAFPDLSRLAISRCSSAPKSRRLPSTHSRTLKLPRAKAFGLPARSTSPSAQTGGASTEKRGYVPATKYFMTPTYGLPPVIQPPSRVDCVICAVIRPYDNHWTAYGVSAKSG